jgi:predicted ribosomally synthesized peptide with SipW-like signal peptide
MKHKKLIVVLAVVVVMAVGASVAYAWWSNTQSLPNNSIKTGSLAVEVGSRDGGPINVSGLRPSNPPAFAYVHPTIPTLNQQDAVAETGFPQAFFWVHNTSDIEAMFYAYLSVTAESAGIRDKIMCRVWLNPVDWTPVDSANWWKPGQNFMVYQGPLSGIDSAQGGRDNLRTWTPDIKPDPIPAGKWGVYKIVFWLDGPSSGPETMGVTLKVDLNVAAGQVEAPWGSF